MDESESESDCAEEVAQIMNLTNELNFINNAQNIEIFNAIHDILQAKRKYKVRQRIDPFTYYDEDEFKRRYRMSKNLVQILFNLFDGPVTLDPIVVREDFTVPGITKLLIALRFYAVGCFAEPLADLFGVSKATACNTVSEVSYIIAMKMGNRYIDMPRNQREILNAKARFHRFQGFPLVVGAVDGTHIRIQSFGGDDAEYYRNRKQYFSINCQIIVSADVCIIVFFNQLKSMKSLYFNRCEFLMFAADGPDPLMMLRFSLIQLYMKDLQMMNLVILLFLVTQLMLRMPLYANHSRIQFQTRKKHINLLKFDRGM